MVSTHSEVKRILSLELLVWVFRAVTDTSKNVKPNDKLLQNAERESQNQGNNYCGKRRREIGEAQYRDILSYFSDKMSLAFTPRRLEKRNILFYFWFS